MMQISIIVFASCCYKNSSQAVRTAGIYAMFASLQAELHRSHLGLQAFDRPLDRYLVIDSSLGPKQAADSCAFQQAFAPKIGLSA